MAERLYIMIAGAGKVGWNLARELIDKGNEVTLIENDRDRYSTVEKQRRMLALILLYWRRGAALLKQGVTLVELRRTRALQDIIKMKFTIPNEEPEQFDALSKKLEDALNRMESSYART